LRRNLRPIPYTTPQAVVCEHETHEIDRLCACRLQRIEAVEANRHDAAIGFVAEHNVPRTVEDYRRVRLMM